MRKSRSSAAAEPSGETVSAALKALLLDPEALSDELVGVRLEIHRDPRMKAQYVSQQRQCNRQHRTERMARGNQGL
ncbi:hypothetical protein [Paraburkholderia atlantica]|uniref:hypothetical protein n=1 Tax=Paraburkholderia atlantica TaxID=2654982 RepID=UPI0012FEAD9F|nr:hypothetical protein [Paraburkholderia atlantica]MBB5507849.1 hypothetical protein [Paraburkholderia atlantica]